MLYVSIMIDEQVVNIDQFHGWVGWALAHETRITHEERTDEEETTIVL